MHLACHLGVPVLAVFLSSAWCFETGPYGAGHRVLQAVDSCLPCLESRPCPHQVRCRVPLEDPALARYLHTDKPEHLPSGLLDLATGFDGLGVAYQPRAGTDTDLETRKHFRLFLQRHLGPRLSFGPVRDPGSQTRSLPRPPARSSTRPPTRPPARPAIRTLVQDAASTTGPTTRTTHDQDANQDAGPMVIQAADQPAPCDLAWEQGGLAREAQWLYREAHWMAPQRLGPESSNLLEWIENTNL